MMGETDQLDPRRATFDSAMHLYVRFYLEHMRILLMAQKIGAPGQRELAVAAVFYGKAPRKSWSTK